MNRYHIPFLFFLLLLIAFVSWVDAFDEIETTREELLASRKRRSEQLEKLLVEVKQRLADHNNGDRILIDEEKASLEKKADIYQRKLDTMKGVPDEREIARMLEKERLVKERARIRQQRNEL